MKIKKINPFRIWYYLRQGYAMYLVFIVAVANLMVTTYFLAIQNIPALKDVFPGFSEWIIFVIGIGLPSSIGLGYWHVKKSNAQRSQMEVEGEINPYYYKLPPGYWRIALMPLFLELFRMNIKILKKETLSDEDLTRFKEIENKIELLIKGYKIAEHDNKFESSI